MPTRRQFVTTLAAGAAGTAVATGGVAAQATDLTEWFANTDGAGEVVDRTGQSEVTVAVGAEGNGGGFAFGPPVVRVDPGTTVVWEWSGKGGSHNVVASSGAFESKLSGESGFTFEHTFESTGVTKYYCTPHKAMGMKGAVVVGDAAVTLPGGGTPTPTATAEETATETETDARSFGGWLADTSNYDGVVDRRGESEITVKVGAEGNGGPLAFEPAAVHVSPGTTVKWEWVGPRRYDIADPDLGYGSRRVEGEGFSYAVEFGGDGLSKYECTEYGDEGMRGVVLVGDGPEETLSWQGLGAAGVVGGLLAAPLALGVRLHAKTATREGKSFGGEE